MKDCVIDFKVIAGSEMDMKLREIAGTHCTLGIPGFETERSGRLQLWHSDGSITQYLFWCDD